MPERDREFEQDFMRQVALFAEHLGARDGSYEALVFHRTDGTGARNYGDTAFLTDDRDLVQEAREEAGDLGVYPMFHAEKRRLRGLHSEAGDEVYHHLALAAAHAAIAEQNLRIVQRLEQNGA